MSVNDQADGFFDDDRYQCPRCVGLPECACTHPHEGFSGPLSGKQLRTVTELMTMPYGMRIMRGFAILSGNKHDL